MTQVDLSLDDELLSPIERAPVGPARDSAPAPDTCKCEICGQVFRGFAGGKASRGVHMKAKHPGQHPKAQPPAARKPAARKAATPRAPTPPKTPPPPAAPKKARKSAASSLSRMALTASKFVAKIDYPTGNALRFESPALGGAIDTAVAGTFIDRLAVQKLAGASERWEQLGSVLSLPIMIFMVNKFPDMQDVFEDDLREAMEDVIIANVPVLERKAQRTAKATDALKRLGAIDPSIAASTDPIGDLLRGFFAPPQADGPTE